MVGSLDIAPQHAVATLGSCFAQHIARHLQRAGFNYFVSEQAPDGLSDADKAARNYGVFSARYGNVYTVRQAMQLFDRAYGRFAPVDDVWEADGGFVDAFRPRIEPAPLASVAAVRASSTVHLACVRDVFERSDWLVFTLGLTEAWRSKIDGAVYPLAPGVAGGSFNSDRHEFVNFTVNEIISDLKGFTERVREVSSNCRIILTVSPVPLIATYEPRHVLVSTVYSKSALRVAADEIERLFDYVTYFPSYELITCAASGGRYYADDLRQVTDVGVEHVMRLFEAHCLAKTRPDDVLPTAEPAPVTGLTTPAEGSLDTVVCDEEAIEAAFSSEQTRFRE